MSIRNLLLSQNFNEYWWLNNYTALPNSFGLHLPELSGKTLWLFGILTIILLVVLAWVVATLKLMQILLVRARTGGFLGPLTFSHFINYIVMFLGNELLVTLQAAKQEHNAVWWEKGLFKAFEAGLFFCSLVVSPTKLRSMLANFFKNQQQLMVQRVQALPENLATELQVLIPVESSLKVLPDFEEAFESDPASRQVVNKASYIFLCDAALKLKNVASLHDTYGVLLTILVPYYNSLTRRAEIMSSDAAYYKHMLSEFGKTELKETTPLEYDDEFKAQAAFGLLLWYKLCLVFLIVEGFLKYWKTYTVFVQTTVIPVRDYFFYVMTEEEEKPVSQVLPQETETVQTYFLVGNFLPWVGVIIISLFVLLIFNFVLSSEVVNVPMVVDLPESSQLAGSWLFGKFKFLGGGGKKGSGAVSQLLFELLPKPLQSAVLGYRSKMIELGQRYTFTNKLLGKQTKAKSQDYAEATVADFNEASAAWDETYNAVVAKLPTKPLPVLSASRSAVTSSTETALPYTVEVEAKKVTVEPEVAVSLVHKTKVSKADLKKELKQYKKNLAEEEQQLQAQYLGLVRSRKLTLQDAVNYQEGMADLRARQEAATALFDAVSTKTKPPKSKKGGSGPDAWS